MAAKTTATTDFNLDLNNLVEEAFERCGAELRSGYDMRTARRSLNLMTMEWANKGINLWTIEQGEQVLTYNDGTYDIPVDTVDLLDHVIRTGTGTNQTDITISRISVSTYATIPNKNATGRPIQVWFQRKTGATDAAGRMSSIRRFMSGLSQITARPTPSCTGVYVVCLMLGMVLMGRMFLFVLSPAWWLVSRITFPRKSPEQNPASRC
jgi:hypothetical protein